MNGIVERAKRLGLYCNLHQMFDRVEGLEQQLQAALDAAHHEAEKVVKLRNGNTQLIEALMDMVNQFFYDADDKGVLTHSFMSAEEHAMRVLVEAGMAEEVGKNACRLLWDKLEERKQK